jgi:hypothetical protein
MSSLSALTLLDAAVTRARELTKDVQAAQQAACETHALLATVLTETVVTANQLEKRLSIYASALRYRVPTLSELGEAILLAARDWLNTHDWSSCPMRVEPKTDEQRRDIEEGIVKYYAGGIPGFVARFNATKRDTS